MMPLGLKMLRLDLGLIQFQPFRNATSRTVARKGDYRHA